MSIHQFIFNHYKKQTSNDPSSLAIFEKKLKSIANTIKDEYIKKYVLEYFLEKISELTPHQSFRKNSNYVKKTKSLDLTKKHYRESKQFSGVELKELSLLYLIINNLNLVKENLNLFEDAKFFSDENKKIYEHVIDKAKSLDELSLDNLNLDKELIAKINRFASIKHILANKAGNDFEALEILEDLKRDLNNYDLEFRIQELESRFSKDFSEETFNELKELKKRQNIN